MCVQIWFWYPTFNYLGYKPRSQISGSYASLATQTVKNLPAVQETQVQSLGREDPLEKGMATHSSFLAFRVPWTRRLEGYSTWGCKESDTTEQVSTHTHTHLLLWGWLLLRGDTVSCLLLIGWWDTPRRGDELCGFNSHTHVSALDGRYLRPLATKALSVTIDKMIETILPKDPTLFPA